MVRAAVILLAVGCAGGQRFGKIITEITPAPNNPGLLYVRSCELVDGGKANIEGVELGDCKRYGVRRSPIVPVPVGDARVVAREHRVLTGFAERPNGGAIVTTCRIGKTGEKWALLDCADTEIATAPLDAADPTAPALTPATAPTLTPATAPTAPTAPTTPPEPPGATP